MLSNTRWKQQQFLPQEICTVCFFLFFLQGVRLFYVCVHAGGSAQHRRRVTGLFPWWSLSLWGGGTCPKDQPCGDPGPLWPLRANPQTPAEHHQCQVVCCLGTRGQSVHIYYVTCWSVELCCESVCLQKCVCVCVCSVNCFLRDCV